MSLGIKVARALNDERVSTRKVTWTPIQFGPKIILQAEDQEPIIMTIGVAERIVEMHTSWDILNGKVTSL